LLQGGDGVVDQGPGPVGRDLQLRQLGAGRLLLGQRLVKMRKPRLLQVLGHLLGHRLHETDAGRCVEHEEIRQHRSKRELKTFPVGADQGGVRHRDTAGRDRRRGIAAQPEAVERGGNRKPGSISRDVPQRHRPLRRHRLAAPQVAVGLPRRRHPALARVQLHRPVALDRRADRRPEMTSGAELGEGQRRQVPAGSDITQHVGAISGDQGCGRAVVHRDDHRRRTARRSELAYDRCRLGDATAAPAMRRWDGQSKNSRILKRPNLPTRKCADAIDLSSGRRDYLSDDTTQRIICHRVPPASQREERQQKRHNYPATPLRLWPPDRAVNWSVQRYADISSPPSGRPAKDSEQHTTIHQWLSPRSPVLHPLIRADGRPLVRDSSIASRADPLRQSGCHQPSPEPKSANPPASSWAPRR
jgi:hypothetical protein